MAEKVTLKTIAREVGLSPATVSLVLNGRPVRVSDENRRRILDVARREHYIPNQIARSLVTQHTQTLGLIVPNIESRFFSSFAKMLEMKCRRRGYALFITNSDNSTSNDADLVRLLVNRGADGIFIITSDEVEASKQLIADLEQLPVPYVMVDRTIDALDCDKVTFNNELGGYLATKYLLDHGHRRIACMVNTASNTGCARLNGYVRALGEKGLELDQSLVLTSDYYIPDAYLAAQQLIRVNATAVVATSDNIALGLLLNHARLKNYLNRSAIVHRPICVFQAYSGNLCRDKVCADIRTSATTSSCALTRTSSDTHLGANANTCANIRPVLAQTTKHD